MTAPLRAFFLGHARALVLLAGGAYVFYSLYQVRSLLGYLDDTEITIAWAFSVFRWLAAAVGAVAVAAIALRFLAFTDDVRALRQQG